MVEYGSDAHLSRAFGALADPTRRQILHRLRGGRATVNRLAEPFPMSLNAVSKHLKVLERAGLVRREVVGREHWISLDPEPLREVSDWVGHYRDFWEERLDRLEAHLAKRRRTTNPPMEEE